MFKKRRFVCGFGLTVFALSVAVLMPTYSICSHIKLAVNLPQKKLKKIRYFSQPKTYFITFV